MTKIRENGAASGAGVLATYGYDDFGRRTSLTRGNGVVTSYAYDAVSRLASLTNSQQRFTQALARTVLRTRQSNQAADLNKAIDLPAWGNLMLGNPPTTTRRKISVQWQPHSVVMMIAVAMLAGACSNPAQMGAARMAEAADRGGGVTVTRAIIPKLSIYGALRPHGWRR